MRYAAAATRHVVRRGLFDAMRRYAAAAMLRCR